MFCHQINQSLNQSLWTHNSHTRHPTTTTNPNHLMATNIRLGQRLIYMFSDTINYCRSFVRPHKSVDKQCFFVFAFFPKPIIDSSMRVYKGGHKLTWTPRSVFDWPLGGRNYRPTFTYRMRADYDGCVSSWYIRVALRHIAMDISRTQ